MCYLITDKSNRNIVSTERCQNKVETESNESKGTLAGICRGKIRQETRGGNENFAQCSRTFPAFAILLDAF